MRTTTMGLALLVLGCGASAVSADPVRVTSGFYLLDDGRDGQWRLQGDGFTLQGQGIAAQSAFFRCLSCPPGTPLSLSSRLVLDQPFDFAATAQIDGTSHSQVYWQGTLDFQSGLVRAAHGHGAGQTLADGPAGTLPFTFTGDLRGFLTPDFGGDPFFAAHLTGVGTAGIWFNRPDVAPGVTVARLLYEFGDPAPVPEPGTMLLLGSGLAGVLAARRRVRKRE